MALVKLLSAGSHIEAQLLKGLLETEQIPCVIHGESRNTDMGTEAGFAEILVLVPEEALAQAKLLLQAQVVEEQPVKPGGVPDGAVCPVHEQQATAICSRCGTYLCAGCGPRHVPPICEACTALLEKAPRTRTRTKAIALVMLLFFFGVPTLLAVILRLFFH